MNKTEDTATYVTLGASIAIIGGLLLLSSTADKVGKLGNFQNYTLNNALRGIEFVRDEQNSTDVIKLSKQNKIFGTQWTDADALDVENYISQNGIQEFFDKIGYTPDSSSKEVAIQTKNGEDFTAKTFDYIGQLIKNREDTGLSTRSVLGLGNDVDLFKNFSITDSNELTGLQFQILKDATNKLSTQDQFGKLITFLRQDVETIKATIDTDKSNGGNFVDEFLKLILTTTE